jgi:hypothetical protein
VTNNVALAQDAARTTKRLEIEVYAFEDLLEKNEAKREVRKRGHTHTITVAAASSTAFGCPVGL